MLNSENLLSTNTLLSPRSGQSSTSASPGTSPMSQSHGSATRGRSTDARQQPQQRMPSKPPSSSRRRRSAIIEMLPHPPLSPPHPEAVSPPQASQSSRSPQNIRLTVRTAHLSCTNISSLYSPTAVNHSFYSLPPSPPLRRHMDSPTAAAVSFSPPCDCHSNTSPTTHLRSEEKDGRMFSPVERSPPTSIAPVIAIPAFPQFPAIGPGDEADLGIAEEERGKRAVTAEDALDGESSASGESGAISVLEHVASSTTAIAHVAHRSLAQRSICASAAHGNVSSGGSRADPPPSGSLLAKSDNRSTSSQLYNSTTQPTTTTANTSNISNTVPKPQPGLRRVPLQKVMEERKRSLCSFSHSMLVSATQRDGGSPFLQQVASGDAFGDDDDTVVRSPLSPQQQHTMVLISPPSASAFSRSPRAIAVYPQSPSAMVDRQLVLHGDVRNLCFPTTPPTAIGGDGTRLVPVPPASPKVGHHQTSQTNNNLTLSLRNTAAVAPSSSSQHQRAPDNNAASMNGSLLQQQQTPRCRYPRYQQDFEHL